MARLTERYGAATRSPWGMLMSELEDAVAPKNGRYPQINLNTGVSLAAVILLLGMVVWSVTLKGDVDNHGTRLTKLEAGHEKLRDYVDSTRATQAQAETKLEGRLVAIETLLRDVRDRLAMAERDRRGERVNP